MDYQIKRADLKKKLTWKLCKTVPTVQCACGAENPTHPSCHAQAIKESCLSQSCRTRRTRSQIKSVKVDETCFTWLCYFLINKLENQSVKSLSLSISERASARHAFPHTDTADLIARSAFCILHSAEHTSRLFQDGRRIKTKVTAPHTVPTKRAEFIAVEVCSWVSSEYCLIVLYYTYYTWGHLPGSCRPHQ